MFCQSFCSSFFNETFSRWTKLDLDRRNYCLRCNWRFLKTYRDFIHQGLDLVDDLVSVGLVNVGAEGDFSLLGTFRYGRHTEHLGSGVKKNFDDFFLIVRVWTKLSFRIRIWTQRWWWRLSRLEQGEAHFDRGVMRNPHHSHGDSEVWMSLKSHLKRVTSTPLLGLTEKIHERLEIFYFPASECWSL